MKIGLQQLTGLFLLMVAAQIATAQQSTAREQVAAAEAAVARAIHAQDFAALDKLLSPQMVVNSPSNDILTRDQVFAAMRQGELKYSKYENVVESFQTYGNVAVLMGHEELVPDFGPEAGKTFYRRYTDVWQQTDGAWVQIARQATYTTATDIYATTTQAAPSTSDTDAGVQAFLTAWVAAWTAHDADAILRLHAEDCSTVNRSGTFFPDRASLVEPMNFLQKQWFKDVQWPPLRILRQRSLTPDLVVVQVMWPQLTTKMPPPWPTVDDMIITFTLKKHPDGWLAEQVDTHDVIPQPKS